MTLMSTLISLAHSPNLTVVEEGVDQEDQGKVLRCDEMQCYLFSESIPFAAMSALIGSKEVGDANAWRGTC